MGLLFSILVSDVFPIFIIAGIGFLLERRMSGSVKALSTVTFNALSPCLIFTQLVSSTMSGKDAGKMAAFCVLLMLLMGIAAWLAAAPLHLDHRARSSFLLVVMFSNSGNYALPLILFAFGREALSFASVYFVTSAMVVYTAGVFIAASGGQNVKRALAGILKVPAVYALAAAAAVVLTQTKVPLAVIRPIEMMSDAALPTMILVLGMQLRRAVFPERLSVVGVAVALSLFLSPIIGAILSGLLGMSGAGRQAAIVLSAMPSAVVTTVLALEFDLDSSFVTSVVFVSTLVSPVTLVLLIAFLKQ